MSIPLLLLDLLSDGRFHSGGELAERLKVAFLAEEERKRKLKEQS